MTCSSFSHVFTTKEVAVEVDRVARDLFRIEKTSLFTLSQNLAYLRLSQGGRCQIRIPLPFVSQPAGRHHLSKV